MNRPGGVPQQLRNLPPNVFPGQQQQQPQQPVRAVSNRLPNGKMANNGSNWAFGSGMPAGNGGGLSNGRPQQMGGNLSFAQSVGGSQSATPLDPSEFPSLSNSSQLANPGQASMWSNAGARNVSAPAIQRSATTPLSSQQQQGQQDDMLSAAGRLPPSGMSSFRFGNQTTTTTIGQPAPPSQPGTMDDFPPLNRSGANSSDIGQQQQDRATANLMSSISYGAQASAAPPAAQGGRISNGLLNALSANNRAGSEARSPVGTRPHGSAGLSADDQASPRPKTDGEGAAAAAAQQQQQLPIGEAPGLAASHQQQAGGGDGPSAEPRGSLGPAGGGGDAVAAAADETEGKTLEESDMPATAVQDPLAGMTPSDRWGMKGLRTLMSIPEYREMVSGYGLDLSALGLDLASNEPLSSQAFSLLDNNPPRPVIPKYRLPECYKVSNVGPIREKISSFNEETLMWIFYSCPGDAKQQLAASELNNRNWRWHKRQQIWLTKDDMMLPQVLSMSHERGYYIVWDATTWRRERTGREITLNYADLENIPAVGAGV